MLKKLANETSYQDLPEEVKEEVKKVLSCYSVCYIFYEYGKYDVSPNLCIRASYGSDHKYIGTYYKNDIWSLEEYKKIYEEVFGYPMYYIPECYR